LPLCLAREGGFEFQFAAGATIAVIGMLLGLRGFRRWRKSKVSGAPPRVRHYVSDWVVGAILVLFGVINCLAAAYMAQDLRRVGKTMAALQRVSDFIRRRVQQNEPIPEDFLAAMEEAGVSGPDLTDGWNRRLRVRTQALGARRSWEITSAGQDGIFDSDDDITLVHPRIDAGDDQGTDSPAGRIGQAPTSKTPTTSSGAP
jgi:hypothetical protein